MINQNIKRQISPNIIKIFILIFVGMAFMNSIIFGITEYRDSKKLILRDFKYTAITVNRSLADTVWRNNRAEMGEIVRELLTNYNVSAVKVINFETKFVEEFIVKQGRKDSISYRSDLVFTYDKKRVKVGQLYIYTDGEAIFYRAKKTLALILFKTIVEVLIVFILLFWAFKKLFTDYLFDVERTIKSRTYIPIDLKLQNSLPLLERAFRDLLNRFFDLYFNDENNREKEKEQEVSKKEALSKEIIIPETEHLRNSSYILDFLNPNREFFQRFFSEIFIYSQPVRNDSGDSYLFIEIERGKEALLLVVDYGNIQSMNAIEIALILKDVEKELIIKYSLNNKLFALSKIVDFMDNKIRNKFSENGVKDLDNIKFKGLAMHYDKVNHKVKYSSRGILIFKEVENKFATYSDIGIHTNDMLMQHKQIADGKKEHTIDMEKGSNIYIATDGIFNQIKKGKEKEVVGNKGFMELLKKVAQELFNSQEINFRDEVDKIKGDKPQSDNITVIGFNF